MNQKAIKIVLSGKLKDETLKIVDKMELKTKKTKEFNDKMINLKIKGSCLIGFSEKEKELALCCRNIKNIKNIDANNLNVYDMLNCKNLIISKESAKKLEEKYKA